MNPIISYIWNAGDTKQLFATFCVEESFFIVHLSEHWRVTLLFTWTVEHVSTIPARSGTVQLNVLNRVRPSKIKKIILFFIFYF